MSKRALLTGLLLAGSTCSASLGQIVSPVPASAPPKVPDYQPPAPPPPPPAAAQPQPKAEPEPDLPPIDLVKRDADGKVLPLPVPIAEAVIEAIMPDVKSEETKEKLRKLVEDRRAAVENAVAKNVKVMLDAREKVNKLDSITGYEELSNINTEMQPVFVNPQLLDMATAAKLLTRKESDRAKKAETEYRRAATRLPEANVDAIIRANVRLSVMEPMRAMDDLLGRAVERWSEVRGQIGLTDGQNAAVSAAEKRLRDASSPSARIDAMADLLKGLSEQQQNAALAAVAKPMPADLPVAPPTPAKVRPPRPGKPGGTAPGTKGQPAEKPGAKPAEKPADGGGK